jgi:hypothetical protein
MNATALAVPALRNAGEGPPTWHWVGRTFSVTRTQFDEWHATYPAINDLSSELQAIDDFMAFNPAKDGASLSRIATWLALANGLRSND